MTESIWAKNVSNSYAKDTLCKGKVMQKWGKVGGVKPDSTQQI